MNVTYATRSGQPLRAAGRFPAVVAPGQCYAENEPEEASNAV